MSKITPLWWCVIALMTIGFVLYVRDPLPVDVAFWDWVFGCRANAQCPNS